MSNNPEPKKSLGQHWLDDQASLEAICQAAELTQTDTILEIGPGPGALTKLLVKQAQHVIAVELDQALAAQLPHTVKADNLEVINSDILSLDFGNLPVKYKIVANIPYYLTSNLIRVISETPNPPQLAVLLIQKEVAMRAAAEPGQMSILAVTAQFYWQVGLGVEVPAEAFTPPPKVDSQVLILKQRNAPLYKDVDPKAYFRLVKAGFGQKRKTLLNALAAGLRLDKAATQALLQEAGIDPQWRAQKLSLDDWHKIYIAHKNLYT